MVALSVGEVDAATTTKQEATGNGRSHSASHQCIAIQILSEFGSGVMETDHVPSEFIKLTTKCRRSSVAPEPAQAVAARHVSGLVNAPTRTATPYLRRIGAV